MFKKGQTQMTKSTLYIINTSITSVLIKYKVATLKGVYKFGMLNVRGWWKWVAKISSMSVSHSQSCCYMTLRCET